MKKRLTLNFERSVSGNGRVETVEVVLTPLNSASDPAADVTLIETKQVKKVRLANRVNPVTFDLTPSYDPGLTEPILYRIAWRQSYKGRITEHDFAMPGYDVDFDDLGDLGHIITGTNYLKESDLGVPGRVARLNQDGQVVDADGNPVTDERVVVLEQNLDQEIRDRQNADALVRRDLTLRIETQVSSLSNTIDTRVAGERQLREDAILTEKSARQAADAELSRRIDSLSGGENERIDQIEEQITEHATTLTRKADLVNGKIPTSQIPSIALGTAEVVADEAAMLALTRQQVQPGDIAVRPDGSFMLMEDDPSVAGNWLPLTAASEVTSVNGQTGTVLLSASDVEARSINEAVPQSDVEGLVATLAGKASTGSVSSLDTRLTSSINTTNANVTALTGRVGTLETNFTMLDAAAVKKNGQGEIDTALLGDDVPRVDEQGTLRRKDGTIISVGGGGTGGAVDSVNGKVGTVVLTAQDVNARPSGVPVPIADVDGLQTALNGKASTTETASLSTRLARAETDIDDIQAQIAGGETGGGSFTTKTAITWVADDEANPSLVTMRSPFGIDSLGIPYYNPEGATEGEAAYPYVSMYGNLVLRKLDPDAPPEPEWGTKAQIDAVAARVTTLESNPVGGGYEPPEGGIPRTDLEQSAQDALTRVDAATASASGSTLVLRTSAGTFSVSTPTAGTHPTTKTYVDERLAQKAAAGDVVDLQTAVAQKASAADVTALTGRVTTAESTLTKKADLDASSLVPVAQIPTLPSSKITGFNLKADLDGPGGKLQLIQVPTGIPQANIDGLTTTLAAKADLVGGKIPSSQIPSIALTTVHTLANRAALLALTSAQVQRGDIGVITATADKGSYILNGDDPSVWANWVALAFGGSGTVESVNGQTGIVVLSAADVGARPTGTAIAQSEVTGLVSALGGKADTSYVDTQVATRTTPAQVASEIVSRLPVKHVVDYVATAAVSLSGAQSIDGVLVPAGKRVLLPAQASSSQNGIWVSQTGAWTRAADMPVGANFMPGTIVAVRTSTNPGANNESLWQITTATAGVVNTNAQNWAKILQAGTPKIYQPGAGITIGTDDRIAVKAGNGIIVDADGVRIDTAVSLRSHAVDVPSGSTTATIAHPFGHRDFSVSVYEVASGNEVLLGITRTTSNIILEFANAPAAGQYRLVAIG